jgi:hypothetical protein
MESEMARNEGPLWPCGCLVGNPDCRCDVDLPVGACSSCGEPRGSHVAGCPERLAGVVGR